MGLGTNRDYKTRERYARAHLTVHKMRMDELMKKGYTCEEASRIAFDEIKNHKHTKQIKKEIEKLKNKGF